MRPLVAGALGVIPGIAVVLAVAPRVGLALLGMVIVVGALWLLSRCRHPGRLGLLPPIVDSDGTHQPARWFCDQCGKSWPAAIEHEATPVVRYAGYDQTKAPAAARRAAEADRRRQAVAVRRAALTESTGAARVRPAPETPAVEGRPTIVAIADGRRARAASAEPDDTLDDRRAM